MKRTTTHQGLGPKLFGHTRNAVLSLLFRHTHKSFYFREIVRSVDGGIGAVQRELANLVHAGLITRRNVGNQVHYQADAGSPLFPEIKSLMIKTSGIADPVREALTTLADRISFAFIYGSFAKGTETAQSDVDVMIVGDVSFSEVVAVLGEVQDQMRREINPSLYPEDEFLSKLSAGHHFLTTLAGEPKIFLIGDQHDFTDMAAKRMVDRTPTDEAGDRGLIRHRGPRPSRL